MRMLTTFIQGLLHMLVFLPAAKTLLLQQKKMISYDQLVLSAPYKMQKLKKTRKNSGEQKNSPEKNRSDSRDQRENRLGKAILFCVRREQQTLWECVAARALRLQTNARHQGR